MSASLRQQSKLTRSDSATVWMPVRKLPPIVIFCVSAAILLSAAQTAATLLLPRGFALNVITDFTELLLMVAVTAIFADNGKRRSGTARLFWILLAICWGIRAVVEMVWNYYDLALGTDVSNPFAGDVLLFLSNIPVLAALLLQTQGKGFQQRRGAGLVDFALLLCWWFYLYLYFVVCWQYVVANQGQYGMSYDRLNLVLDMVLLLALLYLATRGAKSWRLLYGSLFAAQLFITISGHIANRAIDLRLYYPGSLYDLPYTAAMACFTICGAIGSSLDPGGTGSDITGKPLPSTKLGILSLVSLPIITGWSVLTHTPPAPIAQYRQAVVLVTVLVMAALVYVRHSQVTAELAQATEALQEASITDRLTGVRNRRLIEALLTADTSQIARSYVDGSGRRLCDIFYMVDLDNFKEINDQYGHVAGDKVLVEVARRINSVMRDSDVLARWGGDEFLIVSRFTDRSEAAKLAARVLNIVVSPEQPITSLPVQLTCSIGWAVYPWYEDRPAEVPVEAVLSLSDRALYEAKASGKNRAVGFSASSDDAILVAAASGEHVASYAVQTLYVQGPLPPEEVPDAVVV
jgi:diguanylate cyclase (GGDEF)-like protein